MISIVSDFQSHSDSFPTKTHKLSHNGTHFSLSVYCKVSSVRLLQYIRIVLRLGGILICMRVFNIGLNTKHCNFVLCIRTGIEKRDRQSNRTRYKALRENVVRMESIQITSICKLIWKESWKHNPVLLNHLTMILQSKPPSNIGNWGLC